MRVSAKYAHSYLNWYNCGSQVFRVNGQNVISRPFQAFADGRSGYYVPLWVRSNVYDNETGALEILGKKEIWGYSFQETPTSNISCAGSIINALPEVVQENARKIVPALLDAAVGQKWGLIAFTIANAVYETNALSIVENISKTAANANYGGINGNRPGTDDGYNYRGRGIIQITGRAVYQKLQTSLSGIGINVDLVGNPDNALNPATAIAIALIGIRDNLFTQVNNGRNTFDSYLNGNSYDFYKARELVNGDKDLVRRRLPEGRNTARLTAGAYVEQLSKKIGGAINYNPFCK